MEQMVERELARARRLMAVEGHGVAVEMGDARPVPPAEIGALAGAAFRASDPEAVANVYVFESQSQHAAAIQELQRRVADDTLLVLTSSNGALLFFGFTRVDGTNGDPLVAEDRLGRLAAAFAGEE